MDAEAEEEERRWRSVFSGAVRSFRMDRKSPAAATLRAAVADELRRFLGSYSDDVLAEYIVVLVCNGKHQYQARDDLEDFLGDDSAKFVAWLWDHLGRNLDWTHNSNVQSEVANDSRNLSYEKHFQSEANSNEPPKSSFKSRRLNPAETRDNLKTCSFTDGQVNSKITASQAPHGVQKLKSTIGHSVARRHISSAIVSSPERLDGDERLFWEGPHLKKDQNATAQRSFAMPKSDLAARTAQALIKEELQHGEHLARNAATRRLPLKDVDVAVPESVTKRGNVWDRLGKPLREDSGLSRKRDNMPVQNGECKKDKLMLAEHEPKCFVSLNSKLEVSDNASHRNISNSYSDNTRIQAHELFKHTPSYVENSKRKRLLGQINSDSSCASHPGLKENHIQDRLVSQKSGLKLPIKGVQSQSLNEFTSEVKSLPAVYEPCHSRKSSNVGDMCQINVLKHSETEALQQVGGPAQSKTASTVCEDGGSCSNKTMKDMLEVKLKLKQVEMDMLKLRSKHLQMNNGKESALPGLHSHLEEDADSRTLLVTNVHFGATKEALLSHFIKCGTVLKVNMLTDAITGHPKGAACITFASRESVEKALSLSGTSFFSRVITVMCKADAPPGFLASAQQNWKAPQPWNSQPSQKAMYQKQSHGSHLQWKRDQSACMENSMLVPVDKLETSNAGD